MGRPAGRYQRRADLIPNLVDDREGLCQAGKTRADRGDRGAGQCDAASSSTPSDLNDPAKVQAFNDAQSRLTQAIIPLQRLQEAYPDLKSNQNFLALQDQLEGTENASTSSRRDYNEAVQAYNTRIRTFPDAIGAKIFYGAKPKVPFEAAAAAQTRADGRLQHRRAEVKQLPRRACGWRCVRAGRAGCGADLSAADRPRGRPGASADARSRSLDLTSKSRSARGADRAAVRRRDGQQPRGPADRGLWLSARPRLGDRQKDKDDGVILLVAPKERKVWIETGYGAGGFLTDAMSSVIIRENDPPALQAEPARLRRRDRGRRRRDHQADEPAARRSAEERRCSRAGAAAAPAFERQSACPVIFWLMIIGFVDPVACSGAPAGRRYRGAAGGISPWVVLWGLNELSRGSRGGWGGGGGSSGAAVAAAGAAAAAASPAAAARSAAAARRGQW